MNTQQQAYINGFVKRASEYGLTEGEAIELLKKAAPQVTGQDVNTVGAGLSTKAAPKVTRRAVNTVGAGLPTKAAPKVTGQDVNTVGPGLSTKAPGPVGETHSGGIETMSDALKQKLRL